MKRLTPFFLFVMLMSVLLPTAADAQVKREQRAVWMSSYVSDWPSGAITENNQAAMKRACQKMLDTLANNNMNAIYYHVRAMCDAMYNSAYEPWSNTVSSRRGVAPAFDPFGFLVDEAHARGIEVYAWVNPYRYASKSAGLWGQSELDYVYTHPEWLLQDDYETVLNPGIPEVRQRVVDVCKDIITKYDCDGLVFDDYFYNQDGAPLALDSALYNAYVRTGGTMSQGDWRRENVNQMVADVNAMVKSTKPWVRFGIGPAGVACSNPTVAAKYGVDPSPGTDWQYNQIYSDPMAWISRGDIDFMAPQVYWNTAGNYTPVTQWWGKIGKKFNRHVYISSYAVERITDESSWNLPEYAKQIEVMRDAMKNKVYGTVYFKYSTWRNLAQTIDGKTVQLRHYLKRDLYSNVSLNPATEWIKPQQTYGTVTNLERGGDALAWDSVPNVRYVIYAIPDTMDKTAFNCQPQYILAVRYRPAYDIPEKYREGYDFAVTILDRWEREYAPLTVGATPSQAPKPELIAPAEGQTVAELSYLEWKTETAEALNYDLEVYRDAQLSDLVAHVQLDSTRYAIAALSALTPGTFYWRVTARGLNRTDCTSEVGTFTFEHMRITSPENGAAGLSLTPTFTCTQAAQGTQYTLELSLASNFNPIAFTMQSDEPVFVIPKYAISAGTTYYARIKAVLGTTDVQSEAIKVQVNDLIPGVPVLVNPTADGVTLYPKDFIEFEPQEGVQSLRLEISSSTSFPVRTSYKPIIDLGTYQSIPLGEIAGAGKPADGKTYYVRARYAYYTLATGANVQFGEYSPVVSFVYKTYPQGDVNCDTVVNVSDVTELINMILGVKDVDLTVADIDGNKTVNVSDVTELVNILLK